MTDAYRKFTVAVVTKDQIANAVVKTLIGQWFNKYGFPERIHSDQGKNFLSSIVEETFQYYGIMKSSNTPYHPAGNGNVERFNRTLHNLIRILEEEQKTEWPKHMIELLCYYNVTQHETTGFSPYFSMFGRECKLPIDKMIGNIGGIISLKDTWTEESARRKEISEEVVSNKKCKKNSSEVPKKEDVKKYLEEGEYVYIRKRVIGRNKIQNFWDDKKWLIIRRRENVYDIKNEGINKILHRENMRPCETEYICWKEKLPPEETLSWLRSVKEKT